MGWRECDDVEASLGMYNQHLEIPSYFGYTIIFTSRPLLEDNRCKSEVSVKQSTEGRKRRCGGKPERLTNKYTGVVQGLR